MHHLRNCLNHSQAHHDGAGRMVITVIWKATNTVIAVAKNLDPQLVVFLMRKESTFRFLQALLVKKKFSQQPIKRQQSATVYIHFFSIFHFLNRDYCPIVPIVPAVCLPVISSFFYLGVSQSAPQAMNPYICVHEVTSKDSKDPGSLHIRTLMTHHNVLIAELISF